jgi:hypothetical protein
MFVFAGDLGYFCTKGVNKHRATALFPSAAGTGFKKEYPRYFKMQPGEATASDLSLDNLYIKINENGTMREYFVGDLAQVELKSPVYPFRENKIHQPETKALIAALTMVMTKDTTDSDICFATGLPFKHFESQRREFEMFLKGLDFHVWFENGEASLSKRVKFSKVILFPQGVGAIWHVLQKNPQISTGKGKHIGLVDVGGKTTEAIMFETTNNGIELREDLSDTFNLGTTAVHKEIYRKYTKQTGSILSESNIRKLVQNSSIYHYGNRLDFTDDIAAAQDSLFEAIMNAVVDLWAEAYKQISCVVFVGGGAVDLREHILRLHNAIIPDNPQFANVYGYLMVAEALLSKEKRLT